MTLDVYSGLFDDDLSALADRMDAAARAAAEAHVGAVWARPPAEPPVKGKRAAQRGGPRGDRARNPRIERAQATLHLDSATFVCAGHQLMG